MGQDTKAWAESVPKTRTQAVLVLSRSTTGHVDRSNPSSSRSPQTGPSYRSPFPVHNPVCVCESVCPLSLSIPWMSLFETSVVTITHTDKKTAFCVCRYQNSAAAWLRPFMKIWGSLRSMRLSKAACFTGTKVVVLLVQKYLFYWYKSTCLLVQQYKCWHLRSCCSRALPRALKRLRIQLRLLLYETLVHAALSY